MKIQEQVFTQHADQYDYLSMLYTDNIIQYNTIQYHIISYSIISYNIM